MSTPRIIGCIPARYGSTRLPAKPLTPIHGKALILHVVERAATATLLDDIVVLTDHPEIANLVSQAGWQVALTDDACQSGSDRIVDYIKQEKPGDIFVNIQGDEILIDPKHIDTLITAFQHSSACVGTLAYASDNPERLTDPSTAKIVTDNQDQALYFSRRAIPCQQNGSVHPGLIHIGLYIYTRKALLQFAALPPGKLEQIEKLEQLRFLENGIAIHVFTVPQTDSLSIDTTDDVTRAEHYLQSNSSSRP
jgi:3-deoxy-manno-octulosonate cytidylyltransferase (CMP-KDO synthetase)